MANRATREEIVGVADDLFYRRGFDHTSFADIAELVKISRGNFYGNPPISNGVRS